MRVLKLLEEYDLEVDDVRWYLSDRQAERLFGYQQEGADRTELTHLIWSGHLEEELYDMEERFLRELQDNWDRGFLDEAQVRQTLQELVDSRTRRYQAESRDDA